MSNEKEKTDVEPDWWWVRGANRFCGEEVFSRNRVMVAAWEDSDGVDLVPLYDEGRLLDARQDVINQMADNIEKLALTPAKRELVKAAFRACIGGLNGYAASVDSDAAD